MYGSTEEIKMFRDLTAEEEMNARALLEKASAMIDGRKSTKDYETKARVAIGMVLRALGDGNNMNVYPLGATQGSMSANGYVQSWTLGSGGSTGELYFSKEDKVQLGLGNRIGFANPLGGDSNV